MRHTFSLFVGLLVAGVASAQTRPASPYGMVSQPGDYRSLATEGLDGGPQILPTQAIAPAQPRMMLIPVQVAPVMQAAPAPVQRQMVPTAIQQPAPVAQPVQVAPVAPVAQPAPQMIAIPETIAPAAPAPAAAAGQPAPAFPSTAPAPFVQECMPNAPCNTCEPGCKPCGTPHCAWVRAEFLYWAVNGFDIPALVTESPPGTPRQNAGVIGAPGTTVLYGNDNINDGLRPGFRVSAGFWLDDCQRLGVEGNFFFLEDSADGYSVNTPPSNPRITSRPFINAARGFVNDAQLVSFRGIGTNDAELVSFPGVLAGGVTVNSYSEVLGGGVNVVYNLCCDCNNRVDLLAGYSFLRLSEGLSIREDLLVTEVGGPVPTGTSIVVQDIFDTYNEFNGGMIGLNGEWWRGRLFFGARGSIAFGNVHSVVDINGATTVTVPGGVPVNRTGGLLAQGTNIGRYEQDRFAVMPQGGFRVGAQLSKAVRAYAGYDFLYLSTVMRPGDQIDTTVNPTQIPPGTLVGPARPLFPNRDADLWIQGLSLGLELRY